MTEVYALPVEWRIRLAAEHLAMRGGDPGEVAGRWALNDRERPVVLAGMKEIS
jgi:hypothetical protein